MPENRQDLSSKLKKARQQLQKAQMHVTDLEAGLFENRPHSAFLTHEDRYHRVLDGLLEGCQLIGFDWRYLYVNDTAARHGQRAKDELLGSLTIMELYPGIEKTEMFAVVQQCMQDRTVKRMENEFVYPDGTTAWFELSIQPVQEGVFILSLDITERKLAEKAEQEQRQFAEALRDSLAALTSSLDVGTVMAQILDQAANVVPNDGASIIEFQGDVARVLYNRGFSAEANAFFFDVANSIPISEYFSQIREGKPYCINDTCLAPGWTRKAVTAWIRSTIGVPILIRGEVLGVLSVDSATPNRYTSADVERMQVFARYAALALENAYHTAQLEQKVAERSAELTDAKSRVEAILNNSTDGILLAHRDRGIQQSNSTFNRLFGCAVDDYFGKPLSILVKEADQAQLAQTIQSVVTEQRGKTIEVRACRHDDSLFDAELGIGYIAGADKQEVSFVCTIRDITEQKTQERQLRYYASLQASVSDAVIAGDMEFRIQSWNQAAERMYGWRAEEVIGKLSSTVLAEELPPDERKLMIEAFLKQGTWSGELKHHHKDGTEICVLGTATLLKDENGVPFGIVTVNRDITERKQAERVLQSKQDEERKFQKYLQILHDITIELTKIDDLDGFYKQVVQFALTHLGFDRAGLFLYDPVRNMALGTYGTDTEGHIRAEHHLQFVPHSWGGLWNAMQTPNRYYVNEDARLDHDLKAVGTGWNTSVALWYGDQNLGWIVADNLIHHEPVSQSQLEIMAQYGMYIAASLARKRAETASRESETRYRLLAENVSDVVARSNLAGECLYISPSCQIVLGYKPEELIGQTSFSFVHPDDQATVWDVYSSATEHPAPAILTTYRFRHKDGHYLWLESLGRPIYSGEKEEIQGFVTSSRDITERRRLSEELDSQRTFLRNVIDVSPNLIFVKDYHSHFVLGNWMVANLYNTTVEALIGKSVADFNISLKEAERFLEADRRVIDSGETLFLEEAVTNSTGETRWLQTTKVPIVSLDGKSKYVLGVATDITERKQAEQVLQAKHDEERTFQKYLQILHDISVELTEVDDLDEFCKQVVAFALTRLDFDRVALFLYDPVRNMALGTYGTDTEGNLRSEHHLQFTPQAWEGMKDLKQTPNRYYLNQDAQLDHDLNAVGRGWNIRITLWHRNQNLGWIVADNLIHHEPVSQPQLEIMAQYGMYIAASMAHKRAVVAQHESEREQHEFLQQVINSVPGLIIVKDRAGRLQLVNQREAEIHGVTPEAMLGKTHADFNPNQAEIDFFIQKDHETLESGHPLFIPEETVLGRYYQTSKIPLKNRNGDYDRLLVVASDITERKHAEDALRQALAAEKELSDLKSRFVSMASHEFRTPLATILALTETLMAYRHKLPEDQIEQRLGKIQDQIGHLKAIMDDVLLLARMQARRVEFNPVKLDLDALCRSVLDEFQSLADVKPRLNYTVSERVHEVMLDRKLMRQIISNIVSNAIKYSPSGKPVTLNLEYTQSSVILKVRDEGIGIPDVDLKHLFEPFHRAANVGAISGTGLGLVITKESVELQGGTITVDSQVDVGTTFTVRIPICTVDANDDDKNPTD